MSDGPAAGVPFRLRWLSSLVSPRTARPVLEVGCGGGQLLELLAARCPRACLVGLDRSALQAGRAAARLAARPPAARPAIHALALESAPQALAGARFRLVVAMNVNVVWIAPARAGAALRALLAPRGRFLIGYEPPSPRGRSALRGRVLRALDAAGLELLAEHLPADPASGAFALTLCPARRAPAIPRAAALRHATR